MRKIAREPGILNPRYLNATPEMVACALLKSSKGKDEKVTKTGAPDEANGGALLQPGM